MVQSRFKGRRCHARVRFSRRLLGLAALAALAGAVLMPGGAATAAAAVPTDGGSLHLDTTGAHVGDTVRFTFATATPDATNWIGVYTDPATVPSDGVFRRRHAVLGSPTDGDTDIILDPVPSTHQEGTL